jgi:hypothetical protein
MAERTLVWRGIDAPRMEIVWVEWRLSSRPHADGFVTRYQDYLARVG